MLYCTANHHDLHASLLQAVHDRHRYAKPGDETVCAIVDDDIDGGFETFWRGCKQIDPKRAVGQFPYTLHLALDKVRCRACHAKHAIPASITHRSAKLGVGDPSHPCKHDGMLDVEHVAKFGVKGHGNRSRICS